MSGWMVVAIVAIIMSGLVKIYTSRRDERMGIMRDEDGNPINFLPRHDDSAARREIEELRERVKVLERIATDSNTVSASETRRISQEIESLRDRQDS